MSQLALLALVAVARPAGAAESVEAYEHGGLLQGTRWVLWSRYHDPQAALLDAGDGSLRELDVGGWRYPLWLHPAIGGARAWLYGIDNVGAEWILGRTPLEGGEPEILRSFPPQGVVPRLWSGPEGTVLVAVQQEAGWAIEVIDPASGTSQRRLGPLPDEPRFVGPWGDDRWLVIDQQRLWSWPDETVLYYTTQGAPRFWEEPPPMLSWGWPDWALPRSDGGVFLGSWRYIAEHDDDRARLISGFEQGLRYPADGDAGTAALLYPQSLTAVGDQYLLWEKGGQRLLALSRGEGEPWQLHTVWARPMEPPDGLGGDALLTWALSKPPGQHWLVDYRAALDRMDAIVAAEPEPQPLQAVTSRSYAHYGARVLAYNVLIRSGGAPLLWSPEPPPDTLEAVLEQFAPSSFVDVAGETIAGWLLAHEREVAILRAKRRQAIPLLLAQGSAHAAYALAVLRASEADPWLRELALDPTEHHWETGCTYPRSSVGLVALAHLHQRPVGELIQLRPAQRRALRTAAERQPRDSWCGPGAHARQLLDALGAGG